jgi:hypothetical protein
MLIDDRIGSLKSELAQARTDNARLGADNQRLTSLVGELTAHNRTAADLIDELRVASETIIAIVRRTDDSVQAVIDQMETLDTWVRWAYSRLHNLETH